ncbi:hypothetical protein AB0H83_45270 [Dactylosporangium sp. NPDC050688]|uniref:hypothetical protein n=1 Tax=Dactylosporangium sp. NPDC050688 TaxID=3157217 RepID=UPI0033ED804C
MTRLEQLLGPGPVAPALREQVLALLAGVVGEGDGGRVSGTRPGRVSTTPSSARSM